MGSFIALDRLELLYSDVGGCETGSGEVRSLELGKCLFIEFGFKLFEDVGEL